LRLPQRNLNPVQFSQQNAHRSTPASMEKVMSNTPVLCGKCNVQVNIVPNPEPQDKVTCPQCGDSDTFENVKRSLGEQAQEFAARKIQETMRNVTRGSTAIKYTPGVIPQRTHRFVIQFE
jgi:hypothetical protein